MQRLADKLFILVVARLLDPPRCSTNPPLSRSWSCGRLLMLRANQLRGSSFTTPSTLALMLRASIRGK